MRSAVASRLTAVALVRGVGISLHGVTHRYPSRSGPITVLDGVDLEVDPGRHVALIGASGAGKSTLLSLVGGLERPQQGDLTVGGNDLSRLAGDELAAFRRQTVGFVFQHFGLLDLLTARENVEMALSLAGVEPRNRRQRSGQLLDAVGMTHRANHYPTRLSGGERQRVAIARAIANRPGLVLADEPTGNLDGRAASQVLDLMAEVGREAGCTLLVVTHNPGVVERAERVYELVAGRLQAA
jgi:ABC-type lipoprotein export system ATPase subunit